MAEAPQINKDMGGGTKQLLYYMVVINYINTNKKMIVIKLTQNINLEYKQYWNLTNPKLNQSYGFFDFT